MSRNIDIYVFQTSNLEFNRFSRSLWNVDQVQVSRTRTEGKLG